MNLSRIIIYNLSLHKGVSTTTVEQKKGLALADGKITKQVNYIYQCMTIAQHPRTSSTCIYTCIINSLDREGAERNSLPDRVVSTLIDVVCLGNGVRCLLPSAVTRL